MTNKLLIAASLTLAAILAPATSALAESPILVDSPYSCPKAAPWAMPSGSEAHPYICSAKDLGEQLPNFNHKPTPAPVHHKPVVHPKPKPKPHHAPVKHHPAPKHHAKHR